MNTECNLAIRQAVGACRCQSCQFFTVRLYRTTSAHADTAARDHSWFPVAVIPRPASRPPITSTTWPLWMVSEGLHSSHRGVFRFHNAAGTWPWTKVAAHMSERSQSSTIVLLTPLLSSIQMLSMSCSLSPSGCYR